MRLLFGMLTRVTNALMLIVVGFIPAAESVLIGSGHFLRRGISASSAFYPLFAGSCASGTRHDKVICELVGFRFGMVAIFAGMCVSAFAIGEALTVFVCNQSNIFGLCSVAYFASIRLYAFAAASGLSGYSSCIPRMRLGLFEAAILAYARVVVAVIFKVAKIVRYAYDFDRL
jgi:hypothetical protein